MKIEFFGKSLPYVLGICLVFQACSLDKPTIERPLDPWTFRSVLDKKPRMLTLALDSNMYVAYDLANSSLYKAWKGGVLLEGTVYTGKKNIQPGSWGTAYFQDSLGNGYWQAIADGEDQLQSIQNKGYHFENEQIYLHYEMILRSGDTVQIKERPEYFVNKEGKPGLERTFEVKGLPGGVSVILNQNKKLIELTGNGSKRVGHLFEPLPAQSPPSLLEQYDHLGILWMENSDCFTCHETENKMVGPSFREIAQKYASNKDNMDYLSTRIIEGGTGVWGNNIMNAHPDLKEGEIRTMLSYILSLKPIDTNEKPSQILTQNKEEPESTKPGFGAPLEGLHPSYDLFDLHSDDFHPKVAGMAFLPDGRLLVSTWDAVGGLYLLSGVETGNPEKVKVKRIAEGLAEPLGLEVVDGEIFVLQKHELTQLIDLDGDDIIDEYRAICNTWGVTGDFHEFAFGLVYKEGYFYATLSMAMRLMAGERQHPDRGRTIRIDRKGNYEWVNYGLRTPNGIGLGMDNEIFVTDNQGQWLPGNKLVHIREGDYHGMEWGILRDTMDTQPVMKPPTIWLPDTEIGNSPSEVVLMKDGPYKGQLLHGDVSHGGIKRDFLEMVNGEYQGVVFRFTQGLEAGVNRMRWGPDGALYIGEVGMVGGWSWKEKQSGLQKIKFNGKTTFEMLAVRAKKDGFEVEFTEPLESDAREIWEELVLQQYWYKPTEGYGGPKMDLEDLVFAKMEISEDRRKVYLEIPGLKKEYVVYFRLPEHLKSAGGQNLWSSEAWYTLNNIPEQ